MYTTNAQCSHVVNSSVDSEGTQKLLSLHVLSHQSVRQKEDRMRNVPLIVAILITALLIVVIMGVPLLSQIIGMSPSLLFIVITCFFGGVIFPLVVCCVVIISQYIKSLIEQRGKHFLDKKHEQTCNPNEAPSHCQKNALVNSADETSLSSEKKNGGKRIVTDLFVIFGVLFGLPCLLVLGVVVAIHSMPLLGLCMVALCGCILSSSFIYGIVRRNQNCDEEYRNSLKMEVPQIKPKDVL